MSCAPVYFQNRGGGGPLSSAFRPSWGGWGGERLRSIPFLRNPPGRGEGRHFFLGRHFWGHGDSGHTTTKAEERRFRNRRTCRAVKPKPLCVLESQLLIHGVSRAPSPSPRLRWPWCLPLQTGLGSELLGLHPIPWPGPCSCWYLSASLPSLPLLSEVDVLLEMALKWFSSLGKRFIT